MRSPDLIFLHIHSPRSFDSALMGYTQDDTNAFNRRK